MHHRRSCEPTAQRGRDRAAANIVVFFLMLYFIRRPLPQRSTYGGQQVPVRAAVPHPSTAATFLSIAGPVLGVVVLKVLLFGMVAARAAEAGAVISAGHQIIFSALLHLHLPRPLHLLPECPRIHPTHAPVCS